MKFQYLDQLDPPEPGLQNVDAAAQALLEGQSIVLEPEEVCGREADLADLLGALEQRGIRTEVRLHPETHDVYVARTSRGPGY